MPLQASLSSRNPNPRRRSFAELKPKKGLHADEWCAPDKDVLSTAADHRWSSRFNWTSDDLFYVFDTFFWSNSNSRRSGLWASQIKIKNIPCVTWVNRYCWRIHPLVDCQKVQNQKTSGYAGVPPACIEISARSYQICVNRINAGETPAVPLVFRPFQNINKTGKHGNRL